MCGVLAGRGHVRHHPEFNVPSNVPTGNFFALHGGHHFVVSLYGFKGIFESRSARQ